MSRPSRLPVALVAGASAFALLVSACGAPSSGADQATGSVNATEVPDKPSAPVTLNILDIAGNLQLTKGMIENFKAANPDIVKEVTYTTGQAPAMTGKLKAEQQGGAVTTSLVLSGTDGLAAGVENDLLTELTPAFDSRFPGLMDNYLEPAANMQKLAAGHGIEVVYYPSGPLLEYNPDKVSAPPKTPAALLEYAKANPGKVQYANPANSGPGRTFLMGLPYLLGDTDPKDPDKGWDKTWAFLQELGKYTANYPSGTTETMKNLASGAVDIVASTTGWDINPRVLGTVPNTVKVSAFDNMHWVSDAQYALIPKGVSNDVLAADLALIAWMLKPDQQAIAYDKGYFYPGPAVKDVTIEMAPQESQDVLKEFGRAEYADWIKNFPVETSLPAKQQVAAFDKWNRLVGSQK
ncbi:extracellular solute-binding protein [Nakamurella lactea]|uniref:extracellular solute-binding protein n=1 Tax=Nakamurella lactea TaxID=459515 RepID=UPI0012B53A48|nr:extracellular solute-binding protein [Nakamurella lactea]